MNRSRTVLWTIVLAAAGLVFSGEAFATGGGSMYSALGIGDLSSGMSVRNLGMGYAGVAATSGGYLNMTSPGSWAALYRTRLEAGALYQGFSSTDGNASRYISDINLFDATVGFPIYPAKGIALVAGFTRYSTVDFDTYTDRTGYTSIDTIPYSLHHHGTGGIGVGKLGVSCAPVSWLALGASFDYYFGTIEYVRTFVPSSTAFSGALFDRTTTYHGPGATFGFIFSGFGGLAKSLQPLTLGLSISSRSRMTGSDETILSFGGDLVTYPVEKDTSVGVEGETVIPVSYTVGLAYRWDDRYLFAADYSTQLWRHSSFNGVTPADLRNASRIGVGVETVPSREPSASWSERVSLRIGGMYGSTYYQPNGTAINQWMVTAGASLPISSEAMLHIAAEYGARGTTANGLIRDHILRLTASISVGEQWFVPIPEE
jgi:hypothetical protein